MQRTQRLVNTSSCRGLALGLLALALATPALAQDAKPAAAKTGAQTPAAEAKPAEDVTKLDPNDPVDAAKLRGVEAVAPKAILKEGRFSLSAYTGIIPNNIFEQYVPLGLRADYYILENLGVEVAGSYVLGVDTGLTDTLQDEGGIGATGVLLGDKQVAHMNFGVVWSPIFGKAAFQNKSLNYFDFYVFGGFGLVVKQTQSSFGAAASTGVEPEGVVGLGLSLYLNEKMAMRADYRQFIFRKITGGVANPSEASIGFTYFLN